MLTHDKNLLKNFQFSVFILLSIVSKIHENYRNKTDF